MDLSSKGYFKGWYFKCCGNGCTVAFIPAYHCDGKTETVSLQTITDDEVFNIPFDTLEYTEKPLHVNLRGCAFSKKGIAIGIDNEIIKLSGTLRFRSLSPIKYDIMGPFSVVPYMQCRHSVYSMRHRIDGQLMLNGRQLEFQNGVGYIEGDSGFSFPKRYIWTQCSFEQGALMLSVADIPLFGLHFTGIIGVVLLGGKEYRIATYLGAGVKYIGKDTVTVKQRDYQLTATLIESNAHPLYAPVCGKMNRTIHESASSKAYYRFSYKEKTLCEFESNSAGFEFEYKTEN